MVHFSFNQAVPPPLRQEVQSSGADFSLIPQTQMIKGLVPRLYLLGYDLTPPA